MTKIFATSSRPSSHSTGQTIVPRTMASPKSQSVSPAPKKSRSWLKKLLKITLLIILLIQGYFLAGVLFLRVINPSSTAFMRMAKNQLAQVAPNRSLQYEWVDYEQISPNLKRAVIASEDANFIHHHGVEPDAIRGALLKNVRKGKVVVGGSTITQQLAKNMFLSNQRSYLRKAQELIIAQMMELILSKRRILELYLNVVELGEGVFGAQAASLYYYKVHAKNLSALQAAKLASALPAPKCYDKPSYCLVKSKPRFSQKANIILTRMSQAQIPQ